MPKSFLSLEQRFWNKVRKTDGCWFWDACIKPNGYGLIGIGNQKNITTHRFSFIIHFGKIPRGMHVLHSCDVKNCVNPDHLWIGTHQDNMNDMVKKGRHRHRLKPRRGEENGQSKLTLEQVKNIRKLYATGKFSYRELAYNFNVCGANIGYIVNKKIWNI